VDIEEEVKGRLARLFVVSSMRVQRQGLKPGGGDAKRLRLRKPGAAGGRPVPFRNEVGKGIKKTGRSGYAVYLPRQARTWRRNPSPPSSQARR
jgi:hypothetical protein